MIIGILISLSAPSAVISYFIIFLSGMFAGRIKNKKKNKIQYPYIMIIVGFVIGYLIGVYYGSRSVIVTLFILGIIFSYKLYGNKILKDIRF
ncbi:hypothetical protein HYW99_02400 [Candidatus Woesearchaeota archaeon]|nr:hypothetical protein [Candidatus Woesearchaeota archaeon]